MARMLIPERRLSKAEETNQASANNYRFVFTKLIQCKFKTRDRKTFTP